MKIESSFRFDICSTCSQAINQNDYSLEWPAHKMMIIWWFSGRMHMMWIHFGSNRRHSEDRSTENWEFPHFRFNSIVCWLFVLAHSIEIIISHKSIVIWAYFSIFFSRAQRYHPYVSPSSSISQLITLIASFLIFILLIRSISLNFQWRHHFTFLFGSQKLSPFKCIWNYKLNKSFRKKPSI